MIVTNVAITPVYELWHITMCAGHVSQLSIIILWLIKLFKTKYWYTSVALIFGSQLRTYVLKCYYRPTASLQLNNKRNTKYNITVT